MKQNKKHGLIKAFAVLFAVALALTTGTVYYFNDYYHSEPTVAQYTTSTLSVSVTESDDMLVFAPQDAEAGLIFYPGAKVEFTAYAPLMRALADRGILCVLLRMPCNFAFFAMNKADGIVERYLEIKDWYVGGHSLGGVVASSYAQKHTDNFDGVILLASYTTADLSKTNLRAVSIYGSADGVINMDNYNKYSSNLPSQLYELVIEGGCHSYFASYGNQKGDGDATVTREEQISLTAEFIISSICN